MKAIVYASHGDSSVLSLVDREVPEPGPGEVLVRVEFCGVCSSDLGYLAGSPAEGRHLGHVGGVWSGRDEN